ncbi:50S ribosomal protein L15 [Geodia barretti]|uniref:Large ribosomal subunit protein uL15m n=1 Tax=Geodia barretti TaxID=519541 RepID=A0AA35RJG9_GEOBA|nr:50S ribosomal protein L15 [Geodia barretti]
MMEHDIASPKGARRARKRVGRGDAAGGGSTAGRGMKGQKSRSGRGLRPGFEGGQMPLIKGLPMKRGFNNRYKTYYALVDLDTLQERFEANTQVTPELLHELGIIRRTKLPVKVVGDGELQQPLTVAAHKFTASARAKIEAAGGSVTEL